MAVTPDMAPMWAAVAAQIPVEQQKTLVRDITVRNVVATLSADYAKEARAFDLKAFQDKPMQNITFTDCHLTASEFGHLIAVENLLMNRVYVSVKHDNDQALEKFDTR